MPLKIAIVGSGVSGLAALWALKETEHEVHLFEAQDHLGGHVQTVEWRGDNGEKTLVDIAFALFNQVTYPNFCAFLSHMKIPAIPARPTFGLSRDDGRFEWSSTSLFTLFVQWRNIFSLAMWQMVFDIARFNLSASKALDPAYPFKFETVGEFLRRNRYSDPFQNDYFIPLVSSLWIHDPRETLNSIPMVMVVRYLHNHQLLNVNPFRSSLQWLMVDGGAKRYVDAILDGIPPDRLHTSSPVAAVRAHGKGLSLTLDNGSVRHFDRVIMATRAPTSLRILGEYATKPMKNALEKFKTSLSSVTLHSDTRLMPRNRLAWSAWNYHASSSTGQVSLTADMAHLLGRPEKGPILTTLNPYRTPDPPLTQGVFTYEHPIFDGHSVAAQKSIKSIQGQSNVWFAGAWLGYGFHEDGFTSGIKAAQMVCPEINLPFGLREWELGDSQEESWTQKLVAFFTGMVVFAWMRRLYPVVRKMIKARKIA